MTKTELIRALAALLEKHQGCHPTNCKIFYELRQLVERETP
jgi:hypothetical protein